MHFNIKIAPLLGSLSGHLEVEVVPEQSAHTGHRPRELLLVLGGHGPGRGELLHVLDRDRPHVTQMLKQEN